MSKTVFLTGASGFVGSNVLLEVLRHTHWFVIAPTTALHQGSQARLNRVLEQARVEELDLDRVRFVRCDLTQPFDNSLFGNPEIDFIWNIASESHVDRSLEDPTTFIRNNTELMLNVCEYARQVKPKLFFQMGTDEVYGASDGEEKHPEWSPVRPSNPYSASKAAQEAIGHSYWRAYGLPYVVTNTMNLIAPGPGYQDPEKFVPMVVKKLLNNEPVTIHSSPEGESGSRCWIDVRDFADAWLRLTLELFPEQVRSDMVTYYPNHLHNPVRYNIVGDKAANDYVALRLAHHLGVENPELDYVNFHESRPGHDMHYALDGSKIMVDIGWEPLRHLDETLEEIAHYYLKHPEALSE